MKVTSKRESIFTGRNFCDHLTDAVLNDLGMSV
jgi:hypothetical protein